MSNGNREQFIKHLVTKMLDKEIDEIFVRIHKIAKTTDGHIYPEQALKLDDLKNQLTELITEQVMQNL